MFVEDTSVTRPGKHLQQQDQTQYTQQIVPTRSKHDLLKTQKDVRMGSHLTTFWWRRLVRHQVVDDRNGQSWRHLLPNNLIPLGLSYCVHGSRPFSRPETILMCHLLKPVWPQRCTSEARSCLLSPAKKKKTWP